MTRCPWWSCLVVCLPALAWAEGVVFRPLQPGVEYGTFTLVSRPSAGDGTLHVVRVDPAKATLELGLSSEGGEARPASQWAAQKRLSVVINAGMYETDYRSNVGRLVKRDHVNQARWKSSYQSVLVMDPVDEGLPRATMLDRDAPDFDEQVKRYRTVVQNLRLVKGAGENVWKPNRRKWSEAFVALDREGRLLLCFTRTPFSMAELMERVLASELHVVRAMHVEGGPEASLSIRSAEVNVDFAGSYETGFFPRDDNDRQWAIPNVLGVSMP